MLRERDRPPRRPDTALITAADATSLPKSQIAAHVIEVLVLKLARNDNQVHRLAVPAQPSVVGAGEPGAGNVHCLAHGRLQEPLGHSRVAAANEEEIVRAG